MQPPVCIKISPGKFLDLILRPPSPVSSPQGEDILARDFRLAEDCPANSVARHFRNAANDSPSPRGDLSRLGIGERNSAEPKAREGRVSGQRASHWAGVRWRLIQIPSPSTLRSICYGGRAALSPPEWGEGVDGGAGGTPALPGKSSQAAIKRLSFFMPSAYAAKHHEHHAPVFPE